MYKWRNSCIEFQSNIKGKIDKYSSIIKAIKKKLKDERDQTLNGVLNQFNSQASGVESAAQEGEAKMVSILKKCYEGNRNCNNLALMYLDYRSIRETLESFSQSPASGEDKLNSSKWKELDSKNWDEEANVFDESIQKMDKYLDQFLKMKVYYYHKKVNSLLTVSIVQLWKSHFHFLPIHYEVCRGVQYDC